MKIKNVLKGLARELTMQAVMATSFAILFTGFYNLVVFINWITVNEEGGLVNLIIGILMFALGLYMFNDARTTYERYLLKTLEK